MAILNLISALKNPAAGNPVSTTQIGQDASHCGHRWVHRMGRFPLIERSSPGAEGTLLAARMLRGLAVGLLITEPR